MSVSLYQKNPATSDQYTTNIRWQIEQSGRAREKLAFEERGNPMALRSSEANDNNAEGLTCCCQLDAPNEV